MQKAHPQFARPETLRTLAPARLKAFLEPFKDFLGSRGVRLCSDDGPGYEELAKALLTPRPDVPVQLLEGVTVIDELASPSGMDALLGAAERNHLALDLGSDVTPADVAVYFWLHQKQLLEVVHAEQAFCPRAYSFVSFQTDRRPLPRFQVPKVDVLTALEAGLGAWFESKRRGRGSRILALDRPDGVWFLVRHGDPLRREDCWEGGRVCYRPVKYDVLTYDADLGELRINARTQGERLAYRRLFGKHLFGNEEFFPGQEKYTLVPLLEEGEGALDSSGIEGIDGVVLNKVDVHWGGPMNEVTSHKADNVFAALANRSVRLPSDRRLLQASFRVKVSGVSRPRTITVRPSNLARYSRDDDSVVIESWLKKRGFILPEANDGADTDPLLASA